MKIVKLNLYSYPCAMKIIHIAHSVDLITPHFSGGRGRFIFNLARQQAETGHDVFILAAQGSPIHG